MLKIGITGGIGAGKSVACAIFRSLGIPIYDADQRAKSLMLTNKALQEAIKSAFGSEAYSADNQLNRPYLAQLVFSNPEKLKQLNQLVHPVVQEDSLLWHNAQENTPYTLKEAALLYESGSYQQLDKIIVVTAPKELRLNRVLLRDNTTIAAIESRMDKQMPETEKVARADYVIYNDGVHALIPQVVEIHTKILNL